MEKRQLTPDLPTYECGQTFLQILDGLRYSHYKAMEKEVYSHIRTPQNPVNWKDPEEWIPQRLTAETSDLALRLWRESERLVNPRYTFGPMYLCTIHKLFSLQDGIIHLNETGWKFIDNDLEILAEIDDHEGLLLILSEVADKGPGFRRDFLEGFVHFCRTRTTTISENSIKSGLTLRLSNLVQRNLIKKRGVSYEITDAGITYLQRKPININMSASAGLVQAGQTKQGRTEYDPELANLIRQKNWTARRQLLEFLQTMNPIMLEHLIKHLLEEMGYDDVEVTPASNDKGVDVFANIALGISKVREVIQVKRQKGPIGLPILAQLRGSLHNFDAVRGTIVTTGKFSKTAKTAAFDKGAAPITLIDGARLLDLLIKYDIGVRRREIRILEFDEESLRQFETEELSD